MTGTSESARARRRDYRRAVKYNQAVGSYHLAALRKALIISTVKEHRNGAPKKMCEIISSWAFCRRRLGRLQVYGEVLYSLFPTFQSSRWPAGANLS